MLDTTPYELSLHQLLVLEPRHKTIASKSFLLATEEVQAVLAHVILMSLPEVKDKVVQLRIVSSTDCLRVRLQLCIAFRAKDVSLIDVLQLLKVVPVVK